MSARSVTRVICVKWYSGRESILCQDYSRQLPRMKSTPLIVEGDLWSTTLAYNLGLDVCLQEHRLGQGSLSRDNQASSASADVVFQSPRERTEEHVRRLARAGRRTPTGREFSQPLPKEWSDGPLAWTPEPTSSVPLHTISSATTHFPIFPGYVKILTRRVSIVT